MTNEQWADLALLVFLLGLNLWTFLRYSHWRARCLAAEMTGRFLQQCVNYCDREHGHLGQQEYESHA